MTESSNQNKTPLYDEHVAAGARMVPFASFLLPTQYTSLKDEHLATRKTIGLFDVSHMGEIFIKGTGAFDFIQRVSCNNHEKMTPGRAQYTGLMYPEGTFVDDVLVHKMDENEFMLVVNAANCEKDYAYLLELAALEDNVEVINRSDEYAQIAVQGPLAIKALQPLASVDLDEIKYYSFVNGSVSGYEAIIARTGYTGEDGFEVYTSPQGAPSIWRAVAAEGKQYDLRMAGLGARDTLRMEAGMSLYGNEIDENTTPLEAGLGWIVRFKKCDFIGRDVLERQKEEGTERKLVGFEMIEPGIARHGYPIIANETSSESIGFVTSGTHSPTLKRAVGMAFVPSEMSEEGKEILIQIRAKAKRARIIKLPFYSRKK